jgi:ubiquinone/menaquinone biosynthesis C-methylase UbiE
MWSLGDYAPLAARLEPAARELVDACAISAGQEVLDVAAGNGNLAVLAAREGADVVASDLTPAMLELGRARTEEEGLGVEWAEADVEALPFESGRFDCVASVFGAMFAPDPEQAAREMFRVVRPGGTVGMANWTAEGFQGEFFALTASYVPPPPDLPVPTAWGDPEVVRTRLEGLAATLAVEPRVLRWSFESPEAAWSFFAATAGPSVALRRALSEADHERLHADFLALVERWNAGAGGGVEIDAAYVVVVARTRG